MFDLSQGLTMEAKIGMGPKAAMAMTTGPANIRKIWNMRGKHAGLKEKRNGGCFPVQDLTPADLGLPCQGSEGVLSAGQASW